LLTTDKSVKEVALSSGFSSDISFIRVFKKIEDLTPGKLRKNYK
jgi:AraC-like DNA-binding protein